MIANKKEFTAGFVLMALFWVVFAIILSPIFEGKNMLNYMDSLFNSISKKSAYYIPEMTGKAEAFKGTNFSMKIKVDAAGVSRVSALLSKSGATVENTAEGLAISGDLGQLISAAMADAELAYANRGEILKEKHGSDGRQVMYDWWTIFSAMEKQFIKQEKFKESKMFNQARTKVIETAYNYYGIEAKSIKEKWVVVTLSLVGYVIYTIWFGMSILFMFEGWGLKLQH